jgi:cobalt/nickel transport system permease protein
MPSTHPSHEDDTAAVTDAGQIPEWLLGRAQGAPRAAGARRSAVARLAEALSRFVDKAFAAEAMSTRRGLLQRVDPRVKLIALVGLVAVSVWVDHLAALAALVALAIALVALSRIELRRFAVRAWLFVPLFTVVIALPAVTSWVTPGHAVLTLWTHRPFTVGPLHLPAVLAITAPGIASAVRLVLRVAAAVSFSVLLALTTPWNELMRSLRVVRVPRLFVFVLTMVYRYVFVLLRQVQDMVAARLSRAVGRVSAREDQRFVGAATGSQFGRSQQMSEDIYLAMVSRGFRGEVRTLERWRLARVDLVFGSAVTVAVAAVIALELTVSRGF